MRTYDSNFENISHAFKLYILISSYKKCFLIYLFSSIEIEASFPYKDVAVRHGEDPRKYYDISSEELGR